MANTEPTAAGGRRPARRTIVKGAAWAVPVVAVASAAPAFAASPEVIITQGPGGACKLPGNSCNPFVKGYLMTVEVCVEPVGEVVISFGTGSGQLCGNPTTWNAEPDQLTFTTPGCRTIQFSVYDQGSSPQCEMGGEIPFTWTIDGEGAPERQGTLTFYSPTTPPCEKCNPPSSTTSTTQVEAPATEEPAVEAPATEEPAVEEPAEAPAEEEQTADTAEVTSAPDTASTDNN